MINKIGPSDWIFVILDSLESSHKGESESSFNFGLSTLVKKL